MAIYTFKLHDLTAEVIAEYSADLWQSNRDKTNRQAIAIAWSLFSFLAYQHTEARIGVWGGLGNAGEAWAEAQLNLIDWKTEGAVSVEYLMAGRPRTACFSLNHDLGRKVAPNESWFVGEADAALDLVTPLLR